MITATIDKKTSMTTVAVTLQNPKVAAVVADSVVKNYRNISLIIVLPKRKKTVFIWKNYSKNVGKSITLHRRNMLVI